jgi:hypothetical protein
VQVSYSGDDSFEWFGGTVNCKYLIAYKGWDDDFDTDNGYSGKLQFLLSIRDPKIADQSSSNSFESDNNSTGAPIEPFTRCTFSNVTVVGPRSQDAGFSNTTGYITGYGWGSSSESAFPIKPGYFQAAIQIRRESRLACFNSVFTGFPVGLMLIDAGSQANATIQDVYFADMGQLGSEKNQGVAGFDPANWTGDISANYFRKAELNNSEGYAIADLLYFKDGIWVPTATSPLKTVRNLFTDPLLSDNFFDKTANYIGAFKSDSDADHWTKNWANFDPQNTDYDKK